MVDRGIASCLSAQRTSFPSEFTQPFMGVTLSTVSEAEIPSKEQSPRVEDHGGCNLLVSFTTTSRTGTLRLKGIRLSEGALLQVFGIGDPLELSDISCAYWGRNLSWPLAVNLLSNLNKQKLSRGQKGVKTIAETLLMPPTTAWETTDRPSRFWVTLRSASLSLSLVNTILELRFFLVTTLLPLLDLLPPTPPSFLPPTLPTTQPPTESQHLDS